MRNKEQELAKKAYEIINQTAGSNVVIQGLSGVLGFPFTMMADGAVVFTHYGEMLNKIRQLYDRDPVSEGIVTSLMKGMSNELLFDVVADKILGNVPIIGIYFNAICAKAMTWRLGILFTMLSSRGEEINATTVGETTKLIRLIFPQASTMKFQQPSYQKFEKLVVSVNGNSMEQFNKKIEDALSCF